MKQTPRQSTAKGSQASVRPTFTAPTAKQAGQFPGIGQTLSSFTTEPRNTRRGVVVKESRWKRFRKQLTFKKVAILIAIIVGIAGIWLGGKFIYNIHKIFGGNLLGVLSATKLKGEDTGRVNILLAGNSADDIGHDGAQLTDSIMLVSIDIKNNKAFLLSIPRDLWVKIPYNGHAKINEAYVDGQNQNFNEGNYPAGGMGLLEKVVQQNFSITINYYALVNYNAVRDAVNAVGGVDFTVKSVDKRGLYDPSIDYATRGPLVRLTNGVHHLNGVQALDLSRARGDAYGAYGFPQSDFNRTENQRQLLIDMKTKAVSAGVLANPATLSNLSDALGKNVHTDMSLSELKRLYDVTKSTGTTNISSLSLNNDNGTDLLANFTSSSGEAALMPAAGVDNFSDIQTFINKHMSTNPLVQEGAKAAVLNSTNTSGLASKERTRVTSKGISVGYIGDAGVAEQPVTSIIDASNGKMPATLKALRDLYPGSTVTTTNPYAGMYRNPDFVIVLGSDRSQSAQTSTTSRSPAAASQ